MHLPQAYRKGRPLQSLVENETVYGLQSAQLSIFETHQFAEQVFLHFEQPVLASMIEGKKVMHLSDADPFAFLPGESVLLPANGDMVIDFPEATPDNPTKCLALTIDPAVIDRVVSRMNEEHSRIDKDSWTPYRGAFHHLQDVAIDQIVHRLLFLIVEDHPQKDLFVSMNLQELLIRIMQVESSAQHLAEAELRSNNNRLAHIINFIRDNLHEKLTVSQLSQQAYMSESSFYRTFKNEIGATPLDFIQEERLTLASSLLRDTNKPVSTISDHCGFSSLSYFAKVFKRWAGISPSKYRKTNGMTRRPVSGMNMGYPQKPR
ncbi:MAG: AraC family transcriptional regulator [Bacteroidota bacterium]